MTATDDSAAGWIEWLDEDRCWQLVAGEHVGRLGVLIDGAPEIHPVNFVVDDRSILFRTNEGAKLRAIDRNPMVCFEVDCIRAEDDSGWSVLVKGRAVVVDDADELERVRRLPLRVWAIGDQHHWVQVRPVEVTGRSIARH